MEEKTITVYAPLRITIDEPETVEGLTGHFAEEFMCTWSEFEKLKTPRMFLDLLNKFLESSPLLVTSRNDDPLQPNWGCYQPTDYFLATYLFSIDIPRGLFESFVVAANTNRYDDVRNMPKGTQLKDNDVKCLTLNSLRMEFEVVASLNPIRSINSNQLYLTWDAQDNLYYSVLCENDEIEFFPLSTARLQCNFENEIGDCLGKIKDYARRRQGICLMTEKRRGEASNQIAAAALRVAASDGNIPADLGIHYHFPQQVWLCSQAIEKSILLIKGRTELTSNFSLLPTDIIKTIHIFLELLSSPFPKTEILFDAFLHAINFYDRPSWTLIATGLIAGFSSAEEANLKYEALPSGCQSFCELQNDGILIKNSVGVNDVGVYIALNGEIAFALGDQAMRDKFAEVFNIIHEQDKVYLNPKPSNPNARDQSNKIFIKDAAYFQNSKVVACIMDLFAYAKSLERDPHHDTLLKSTLLIMVEILRGDSNLRFDQRQHTALTCPGTVANALLGRHEVTSIILRNTAFVLKNDDEDHDESTWLERAGKSLFNFLN